METTIPFTPTNKHRILKIRKAVFFPILNEISNYCNNHSVLPEVDSKEEIVTLRGEIERFLLISTNRRLKKIMLEKEK
jgi:hypothetical protein